MTKCLVAQYVEGLVTSVVNTILIDVDLFLSPEAALATESLIHEHFEREGVINKIVHYVAKWKEKDEQEDP